MFRNLAQIMADNERKQAIEVAHRSPYCDAFDSLDDITCDDITPDSATLARIEAIVTETRSSFNNGASL